jgi:undecaprenyl-diphosphatase
LLAVLPFRARPLSNPSLGLHFPIAAESWGNWSSFPSDHAALFSLLTFCLFTVSFRLGFVALLDTVFLICLPRVMVGVHYPTDILGGALLGLVAGIFFARRSVRIYLSKLPLHWMHVHPASFYACAFLLSFLMAHAFFPVISLLLHIKHLAEFLGQ